MTDHRGEICTDCEKALPHNPRRLGTRCKQCNARNMARSPDKREKCRVAMLRRFDEPGYYAGHCERVGAGIRRALQEPARMEDLRERGRRCGLLHLGHNRHGAGSPERAAAGRKRSETLLAWCPIEYRPEYRHLIRTKLIRAPEARRLVEDMIARDLARYAATGKLQQASRQQAVTP